MSWEEYFMQLAIISSKRSKDPNTKVGACIISNDKKILSMGYNGAPRGIDNAFDWNTKEKYDYVCHAEMNAILNTNNDLKNSILYTTLYPCNECAKAIIQKGISEIVYLNDPTSEAMKSHISKKLFEMKNIKIKKYEGEKYE